MTEQSDQPTHDVQPTEPIAAEPTPVEPKRSRWERVRPRGRLGQIAAILVATAAAIFIAGSIFVAGIAVGSDGGGGHHGHGGDGYSHSHSEGQGQGGGGHHHHDGGGSGHDWNG